MSLPISDPLISGSTQALATYNPSWTVFQGSVNATTSGSANGAGGDSTAYWNADSFSNDQYAMANTKGSRNGSFSGVAVRCSAGINYYAFRVDQFSANYQVIKVVAGVFTNLSGTPTRTFLDGDLLKLTAIGTTITAYHNNIVIYSTTDSALASGSAGLEFTGAGAPSYIYNWQGGNGTALLGATWLSNLSPSLVSPSGPLQFWSNPGSGIGLQPGGFPFPVSNGPNPGGGGLSHYRRGYPRSVRN